MGTVWGTLYLTNSVLAFQVALCEVSWWDEQLQIDLSKSPLFGRRWTRIVLDEAHRIKNARGSTAQAAFNLRAQRRWCVSGTPMQNRIGEVGSLVRFLRFYPYGFNKCQRRGCDCECLFVKCADNTSLCQVCGHSKTQHCSVFAKQISTPIRQFGFTGEGKAALESLRLEIFHQVMLRRTKSTLDLPKLSITKKKVLLSERERRTYTRIKTRDRQIIQELIAEGKLMQNFAHIFSIIMRQRQAANHPQLAKFGLSSDCPLCTNPVDEMDEETEVLPCGLHACHQSCHIEYMRDAPDDAEWICPCEWELHMAKPLRAASIVEGLQDAEQPIRTSSKIEALIQEIEFKLKDSSSEPQKFLVFSSFAHFLQLCGYFMDEAGITNEIISGKTDMKSRARIIQQFRETDLSVLLITLQVGGEGLNLQVANRVYLLDPWWNPAMEQQAYQRAHRALTALIRPDWRCLSRKLLAECKQWFWFSDHVKPLIWHTIWIYLITDANWVHQRPYAVGDKVWAKNEMWRWSASSQMEQSKRKYCSCRRGSNVLLTVALLNLSLSSHFPFRVISLTEHRCRRQAQPTEQNEKRNQDTTNLWLARTFWQQSTAFSFNLFSGTVAGCNESLLKLTSDDIQMLFRDWQCPGNMQLVASIYSISKPLKSNGQLWANCVLSTKSIYIYNQWGVWNTWICSWNCIPTFMAGPEQVGVCVCSSSQTSFSCGAAGQTQKLCMKNMKTLLIFVERFEIVYIYIYLHAYMYIYIHIIIYFESLSIIETLLSFLATIFDLPPNWDISLGASCSGPCGCAR